MISLDNLVRNAQGSSGSRRFRAAKDPRLANINGGRHVARLARSYNRYIRSGAAQNPRLVNVNKRLGWGLVKGLARNGYISVRESLAQNPGLANENNYGRNSTMQMLAKNESDYVRKAVTKNPRIEYQILKELTKNNNYGVRTSAIMHLSRYNNNISEWRRHALGNKTLGNKIDPILFEIIEPWNHYIGANRQSYSVPTLERWLKEQENNGISPLLLPTREPVTNQNRRKIQERSRITTGVYKSDADLQKLVAVFKGLYGNVYQIQLTQQFPWFANGLKRMAEKIRKRNRNNNSVKRSM